MEPAHFIGTTDVIASIGMTGDIACVSNDTSYRVDTPVAQDFLADFVALPEAIRRARSRVAEWKSATTARESTPSFCFEGAAALVDPLWRTCRVGRERHRQGFRRSVPDGDRQGRDRNRSFDAGVGCTSSICSTRRCTRRRQVSATKTSTRASSRRLAVGREDRAEPPAARWQQATRSAMTQDALRAQRSRAPCHDRRCCRKDAGHRGW